MTKHICQNCNEVFINKYPNSKFCSRACYFSKTPEERFYSFVIKSDNPDDCWQWTGCKCNQGYGLFSLNSQTIGAHRFSYGLHKGEIPEGMCVCHRCDNQECTNPNHLWLGTDGDNTRDKESKGRGKQPKGEKHGMSKLTESAVLRIRELVEMGLTNRQVAMEFNIHRYSVDRIISRKTWKHI